MSQDPPMGGAAQPPRDAGQPSGHPPPAWPGPTPWPYGPSSGMPPGAYGNPGPGQYGGPPPVPPYMAYPPPAAVDPTLAEFWQRLVARIVDTLVIFVVASPLMVWYFAWYIGKLSAMIPSDPATPPPIGDILHTEVRLVGISLLVGLAIAGILFVYDALTHARWGQTLGKRVMHIRVVALPDRSPITGGAAAKRATLYALAPQVPGVGGIFGLVNVLWLLWDKPYRQCLHDKVAHTIVVKTQGP